MIAREYVLKTRDPDEPVLSYDFAEKTWQEIDRSCFLRFRDEKGNLEEIEELHALWYLEQEQAFNGEGDDAAVERFLERWTEEAKKRREEWAGKCGWPAKYVKTSFYLNGKQYVITPDSIGLERGEPWDEGFLEHLQGDIGAALKELGATEIRHEGFPD